jgi:hypothetical protein
LLVFAGLLAVVTTLLSAGVASADFWPHSDSGSPVAAERDR